MLKTTETVIDGHRLRVTQLALGQSRPMFFKLTKICGPAVVSFMKALDGKKLADVALPVMADAIGELIKSLDYETFNAFVQTFARVTETFDEKNVSILLSGSIELDAFGGNYGTLLKWLAFCLEFNFASFLSGWDLTIPRG
jgi:hypothetical protein